eukprot:10585630-Karenia_brevis.AAC.1
MIKEDRIKGGAVVEEAPKGVKGSSGIVERAVQDIEDAKERIVAFIPSYAAYPYNRLHRDDDGKAPYERVKGQRPTVIGIRFGEKVLYMRSKGSKMEKIKPRMEYGIFVG